MGINFGTDGWRAVIAEDYTFENVRIVAQSISDYIKSLEKPGDGLVIGYDHRFASEHFAKTIAEVVASNEIPAALCGTAVSTPVVSTNVALGNYAGGIMVTASHNPPHWNGIKFKTHHGGSAPLEVTTKFEEALYKNKPAADKENIKKYLDIVDLVPPYIQFLRQYINLDLIDKAGFSIAADYMHGSGAGLYTKALEGVNCKIYSMRENRDVLFGGHSPEPIPKTLQGLSGRLSSSDEAIGLATDGDGDRLGAMDSKGAFITPHLIMPLYLMHMKKHRHGEGTIVKAVSMADYVKKVAADYDTEVIDVAVGFKNVCEKILEGGVMVGGEESGGFAFTGTPPERDGILCGLLLLEAMAAEGTGIDEMLEDLQKKYGYISYKRNDAHCPVPRAKEILTQLKLNPPKEFAGYKVARADTLDGIKFIMEDGSWILIRGSNTEPVLRLYVGSDSENAEQKVDAILAAGNALI